VGAILHSWYPIAEAVATFDSDARPERFCDGQFVVLPSVVLCFVTIGQTTDEPHVSSPSQVVWRPKLDMKPATPDDWLPERVREVWDRSGKQVRKIRDHHLFLRTAADDWFCYAGDAHLGSYGSMQTSSGEWGLAANFSLRHKLPRDVWLKLGGYPGWLVEVNHECHRVEAGDLSAFEQLVGELAGQEFSHLCMTRYEEDSLTVHTNATRAWLMYLRFPADSGVYTRDLAYQGPPESEEVFQCVCGIDLEFPTVQTLPRELATQAAAEFFQTGQLPRCVHWKLG
jgi:hypothetical protein